MAMGAVVARILTQYSDKGSKAAQKDIAKLEKKINDFGKKAQKSFGLAIAATATLAIKISKDAVDAAIEDSKSQAILAQAMANSTGATNALIASAEDYIKVTMFRTNTADDLLRASLAQLYVATGDLTEAQKLQSIALDVAAASGKDLSTVTVAITKAQQGNVGALKKLSPEISALITTSTSAADAFAILGGTYYGTAEQLANLDPLKKLQLSYGEVLETLGNELLPVIKEFADIVVKDVLPIIDEWIKANGEDLRGAVRGALKLFISLGETLVDVFAFLDRFDWLLKLGVAFIAVGRAAKVFGTVMSKGIRLTEAFKSRILAFKKTFESLTKSDSGVYKFIAYIGDLTQKLGKAIFGFMGMGIAIKFAINSVKSLLGLDNQSNKSTDKKIEKTKEQIAAEKKLAEEKKKAAAVAAAAAKRQAQAEAAAAAKEAAAKAAIAKGQAALAKFGVKTTEDDPIQLEAARLNLVKQGNLAEAARVAAMSKNLELQLEANKALARYNDLLAVLADKEITSNEVLILSKKWGMTVEATQSYIQTLIAVADQKISDEEITNLAKAWGVSKEQASRYLDFFTALNDGKLSDAEIRNLQSKWGLTSKEVGIYQDLITKASDYVLSDAEINDLKKNWGLTTDEVIAYIKKLGQPVTFSGTLIDPATQATLGWKSALAALEAYQKALAGGGYKSSGTTTTPSTTTPSTTVVPTVPNVGNIDAVTATVKSQTETFLDEIKNNQTLTKTASEIANEMAASLLADEAAKAALGGTAGVLSSARYTGQALQYYAQQEAAAQQAAALQRLKEAEAAAKATKIAQLSGEFDSPTIDNAGYIASNSAYGSPNITINVAGSVTTEGDLIANIRNGLLNTQYNGNSLLLSAAAI